MARLLVVDDDAFSRKLMSMYLGPLGGQVEQAGGGEECLQKVAAQAPDLILMDCQMPEMDGFETVTRLRAGGYRGIILALTGNSDEATLNRCREVGMNGHLAKPIQAPALKQAVQQALGQSVGAAPSPPAGQEDDDPTARVRQLAASANNPALLQRLAASFLKNASEVMVQIEGAQGQPEQLQALGHKLRGSAGSFGARRLGEEAGKLEASPAIGLEPLREEWARVRSQLEALIEGGSSA